MSDIDTGQPLCFASTEEIFEELARRNPCVVLLVESQHANEQYASGNHATQIGLASLFLDNAMGGPA